MNNSNNDIIPGAERCFQLMDLHHMLPNIMQHSIMVCKVALSISKNLNRNGEKLNLDMIRAAALLHDITKTISLKTGENHAETGSQLLIRAGYRDIAEIVAKHINPETSGKPITEAKIVSYADKRVMHDKVVSLDERFAYLMERYGKNETAIFRINNTKKQAQEIETKIFAKLGSGQNSITNTTVNEDIFF